MHPGTLLVLSLLGWLLAACSTDPKTGVVDVNSLQTSARFEHRTQARSDGKTMLIVTPRTGVGQDATIVANEAQAYAERHVSQVCPKGYDFYGHAALFSRKGERTFVFQCR